MNAGCNSIHLCGRLVLVPDHEGYGAYIQIENPTTKQLVGLDQVIMEHFGVGPFSEMAHQGGAPVVLDSIEIVIRREMTGPESCTPTIVRGEPSHLCE